MSPILILTNCDTETQAERIADALLDQHLAAAVQIIGPTRSRYRWQGEIHHKQEWLLLIKTSSDNEQSVTAVIQENHDYKLPGILKLNIDGGDAPYLRWIVDQSS